MHLVSGMSNMSKGFYFVHGLRTTQKQFFFQISQIFWPIGQIGQLGILGYFWYYYLLKFCHCVSLVRDFALLMVSKSRKQIILSSHNPKTNQNFHIFFALASKSGRIKKILYCVKQHQIVSFMLIFFVLTTFQSFLEARAKKMWKFQLVFWGMRRQDYLLSRLIDL